MPIRVPAITYKVFIKNLIEQKNWRDFFPAFLEAKADFGGRQRGLTYDNTSSLAVSRTNRNTLMN